MLFKNFSYITQTYTTITIFLLLLAGPEIHIVEQLRQRTGSLASARGPDDGARCPAADAEAATAHVEGIRGRASGRRAAASLPLRLLDAGGLAESPGEAAEGRAGQ